MKAKKINIVNKLLMADFAALAISGFLIHGANADKTIWAIIHSITAVLCMILVLIHIFQHKKYYSH